jgi:pimeloyl-ACP methyl ester carboxylesterase
VSLPGTFVSTTAGRIFIHKSGRSSPTQPPLVLLHGWMMSHYYFRSIVDALADDRLLVALDLPGHGESDRPLPGAFAYTLDGYTEILDEALRLLELPPRLDFLGASMGGAIALTLAARRPERVHRLVLAGAAIYPPPALPLDAKLLLAPGVGPFIFKHLMSRREFTRACRRYNVRDGHCLDDDWVDYFWARMQRPGGMDAAYTCMRMLATLADDNPDPARVVAPTLLVWGDEDRLVPLAQGKRLARAIPSASLTVIPASGHLPFVERPHEFLRAVRPFLTAPAEPLMESPIPPRRAHSVG